MVKIKLSALHRIYSKSYPFHILAVHAIMSNRREVRRIKNEMDAWVICDDKVKPIVKTLLEKNLIYSGEFEL